jgi:hypothetical protein
MNFGWSHSFAILGVSACAWLVPAAAQAQAGADDERAELEQLRSTTLALIQALVEQGLISRERADALVRQATARRAPGAAAPAPGAAASAPPVVRVPYLPETLKAQIKDDIRNDVMATAREEGWADSRQIPAWLQGIGLEGDIRVRAQGEIFDDANLPADVYRSQVDSPAWSPDLLNTQNSRQRLTLRARLALNAKISDDVSAALRLATGSTSGSPTSESQTLGNHFNRLTVGLDRAWLRWEPRYDWRLEGGRIQTPFFGTDLAWPDDLSLDGMAVRKDIDITTGVLAFATAGAFQLEEFATTKADKWLYGVQAGTDWAIDDRTQLRLGLGYYHFYNIEGTRETQPPPTGPLAGTVPYQTSQYPASVRQRGNTLINLNDPTSTAAPVWGLASRFKPFNLTTALTLGHFEPLQVGVVFDYLSNAGGFDAEDIRRRAGTDAVNGLAKETTAFQWRVQVGSPRLAERGDWQGFLSWRKLERDAWVDAFTDTTWHLGGTGYKGFSLGGAYTMDRRTSVGLRWTSTRNEDDGVRFLLVPGDPTSVSGNLSSAPLKIDVIQLEVNARF